MALKFLNKKGWHTGSLRNIENVWKAEQKHDAEQKKLEELRKQIQEERERSEFRLLQEQAGLVPRQERLDFLYESGLAVGKSSESFKELAAPPSGPALTSEPSSSKAAVLGALFEDKPQSANDSWRKLHSDPLLLIRQREKEALDRIKNNPMKMAMIKKLAEAEKPHKGDAKREKKDRKGKHKLKQEKRPSRICSDSEETEDMKEKGDQKYSLSNRHRYRLKRKGDHSDSDDTTEHEEEKEKRVHSKHSSRSHSDTKDTSRRREEIKKSDLSKYEEGDDKERKSVHAKDDGRHEEERRKGEHSRYDDQHEAKRRKGDSSEYDGRHDEERRIGDHSRGSRFREEIKKSGLSKYDEHDDKERKDVHTKGYVRHEDERRKGEHSQYNDRHEAKRRKGDSSEYDGRHEEGRRTGDHSQRDEHCEEEKIKGHYPASKTNGPTQDVGMRYRQNRNRGAPKLSEEERAARLREMKLDAELHEEQRWKRLKKAAEADAKEATLVSLSGGKNFLDAAQKSIFGAEKGGSATIEESLRRRTFYSQGGSAHESNAFRR